METVAKTDVAIIQELLALYAARKESIGLISQKTHDAHFLESAKESNVQTDEAIQQLMDELSLHGDAVMGDVDRANKYLNAWKAISPSIDTMDEAKLSSTYKSMEDDLLISFLDISANRTQDGDSLSELLTSQETVLRSRAI